MPGREKCGSCVYKYILIQKYKKKNKYLVRQNKRNSRKTPFTRRLIKRDHEMNCSVVLVTIKLFSSVLEIEPYTKDMVYWRDTKRITSVKVKRTLKFTGA